MAQKKILRRNTCIHFYIPRTSYMGTCTWRYCSWWVKNSTPYLSQSVQKVHVIFTNRPYEQRRPILVISRLPEVSQGIKKEVLLSDIEGGTSKERNPHEKDSEPTKRLKRRAIKPLSKGKGKDVNFKRIRYERVDVSSDTESADTSSGDSVPHFEDVPIPDPSEEHTSSENRELQDPPTEISTPSVTMHDQEEQIDYADSDVSLIEEISENMTISVHTMFGEVVSKRTKEYAMGLIEDIFQIISSSNTLETALSRRSEIETMLGFLHAITSQAKSGKLEMYWLAKNIQKIFDMATNYASNTKIIQQVDILDIPLIQDLNCRHEEYTTTKKALDSDLLEFSKKLEVLKTSEADIIAVEEKARVLRNQYETEKSSLEEKIKVLESSLKEHEVLGQELHQSKVKANTEMLQGIEDAKASNKSQEEDFRSF